MRASVAYCAASLVLGLALAGCTNGRTPVTPAPDGTVRIVSSLPTRGQAAGQARAIEDAISLAIRESGGKAGGFQVEYIQLDDSSDETGDWSRDKELANATSAADDASVVAYIGPYNSGAAAVSLPVSNRAGLLQISPSVTWPGLTSSGWDAGEPERYFPTGTSNFVRLMPPDSVEAGAAAQWAADLNLRQIAILEDGSSYSNGMAAAFSRTAPKLGVSFTISLTIDLAADTIPVDRLGGAAAVFYAPSTISNAVKVAKSLKQSGLPVFATDTALDPQFIDQAGDSRKSWHLLSNSVPPELVKKIHAVSGLRCA